jgi:hypothetical protein
MPRFSLLDTPHKGLRVALAQLSQMAGNINYMQYAEVLKLQQYAQTVFTFLHEHAEIEETYILPALEERMPGSTSADQEDHERLHALQDRIEQRLYDLPSLMGQPEALAMSGKMLYQELTSLQAGHLEHMLEEERGTQQLMWECFTDKEILEIYSEVLASFTPKALMNSLQFILPAQTHSERSMMLKGMRAKSPAEVVDQVMMLARGVLSSEAYEKLSAEILMDA